MSLKETMQAEELTRLRSERDAMREVIEASIPALERHWEIIQGGPEKSARLARLKRARAILSDGTAESEWRPIETAPKDGTEVLLFGIRANIPNRIVVGHYTQGGGDEQPRFGPDWFHYNGSYFSTCQNPTHWRPLPPPPHTKSEDKVK